MDYSSRTMIHRIKITSIPSEVYSEIFIVNGLVYVTFGCCPRYQNGQISIHLLNDTKLDLIQNMSFEFCLGKLNKDKFISPIHDADAEFPLFGNDQLFAMEELNHFDAKRIKAIPFSF